MIITTIALTVMKIYTLLKHMKSYKIKEKGEQYAIRRDTRFGKVFARRSGDG